MVSDTEYYGSDVVLTVNPCMVALTFEALYPGQLSIGNEF